MVFLGYWAGCSIEALSNVLCLIASIESKVICLIHRLVALRLLSACPHCQHPLRFNPFYAAAEDYADVLHLVLEYSRREKGADHEETLAHLLALAVHLENAGKTEEAAEFRREHDGIAGKKGEDSRLVAPAALR